MFLCHSARENKRNIYWGSDTAKFEDRQHVYVQSPVPDNLRDNLTNELRALADNGWEWIFNSQYPKAARDDSNSGRQQLRDPGQVKALAQLAEWAEAEVASCFPEGIRMRRNLQQVTRTKGVSKSGVYIYVGNAVYVGQMADFFSHEG